MMYVTFYLLKVTCQKQEKEKRKKEKGGVCEYYRMNFISFYVEI